MLNKDLQKFYTQYKLKSTWQVFLRGWRITFWLGLIGVTLSASSLISAEYPEKVRIFTRPIEFNYAAWILDAMWEKTLQSSVTIQDYLPAERPTEIVREVLKTESRIGQLDSEIAILFTDPNKTGHDKDLQIRQEQLAILREQKKMLAPLAEATLQEQINSVLAENGLAVLGQSLPPVLYHSTPLPMALIVSPRDSIQQDANISLLADMTAGDMTALEDRVMRQLGVSALVVPVGGVGIYPTMVMATSNLTFLADTVAHEWTHNFLTTRPLGLNYETSSQLRTINETTASIVGGEIGHLLLKKYYPDLLPPEQQIAAEAEILTPPLPEQDLPEPFNYRKEMNITRIHVDKLLAAGSIQEAEDYMEQRRQFLWENGYPIRRLNQAYFAFYGAYADVPGGAAGEDPVGPTVRKFREQSKSLSDFLNKISWVTSYSQLVGMVR